MKTELTVGSLFSGIGGIDLGLERAGMKVVWMCEINKYAVKVLNKHWPDVPVYDDVKKINTATAPRVDVLCGGFPCQDVSFAGKREGLKVGTRTGLWIEFVRIICDLRPRYVLLENVPGLLSLGFGRVLGDLAEIGYDAEWQVLSAAQFGAWHLRRRVFIVAYLNLQSSSSLAEIWSPTLRGCEAEVYDSSQGSDSVSDPDQFETSWPKLWEANPTSNGCDSTEASGRPDANRERYMVPELFQRNSFEEFRIGRKGNNSTVSDSPERRSIEWQAEPSVGRLVNGIPNQLDQLRCLGNAVVPQIAEYIGSLIVKHHDKLRGYYE